MRRPMMRRTELPDFCLFTIPSTGQLIILKKGVRGYYASVGYRKSGGKSKDCPSA